MQPNALKWGGAVDGENLPMPCHQQGSPVLLTWLFVAEELGTGLVFCNLKNSVFYDQY
jgi:hypothetical protein